MLEIKNLTKVYKTKGGAPVHALDGVSITFEEKGMVFLLGKSGSGKSTLLNLCGGLDSPDSGEIIIKGRSSKDFSQSDFDSYRNTFIGFVFQEYNILNEFSVEDNIALALELQGKNKDKSRVQEILKQVELENFAKRKPNTLSGGQKQRVAIARALVKNPEIIMADEPTGALDSNTGKQVFDTLKKLSADKLVIVVSHDREFAEIYGDRIIELKDGKIISDVTKTQIAAKKTSDNLSFIGDDTISVKDGAALTDSDLKRIRDFLASAHGNVLLSCGKKEIDDFKKAARIDENNAREAFRDTRDDDIEKHTYTREDSRFIRSKLPARHAIRIGASSMKVKPFRLFFTILLSFIAFTMFGLFSTLTFYDENSVHAQTLEDTGYEYLGIAKEYRYTRFYNYGDGEHSYESTGKAKFTPSELAEYKQKYGAAAGAYGEENRTYSITNTGSRSSDNQYYNSSFGLFIETEPQQDMFRLLTDTDLSALGKNDVVISSYLFDSLKNCKLFDISNNQEITLENYSDIIGKQLGISANGSFQVTVKGVFSADMPSKYDPLKEVQQLTSAQDYTLASSLQKELSTNVCCAMLVGTSFYAANSSYIGNSDSNTPVNIFNNMKSGLYLQNNESENFGENIMSFYSIAPFNKDKTNYLQSLYLFEDKSSLADDEIVVPFSVIEYLLQNSSYIQNLQQDFYEKYYDQIAQEAEHSEEYKQIYQNYYSNNYQTQYENFYNQKESELRQKFYEEYMASGGESQKADAYVEEQLKNSVTEIESFAKESAEAEIKNMASYDLDSLISSLFNERYNQKQSEIENAIRCLSSGEYIDYETGNWITASKEDIDKALETVLAFLEEYQITLPSLNLLNESQTNIGSYKIAGFFYGFDMRNYSSGVFFSEQVYQQLYDRYADDAGYSERIETKYEYSPEERFSYIIFSFPDRTALNSLVAGNGIPDDHDVMYALNTAVSLSLETINFTIQSMEQVFLWIGIVMAVFSMLLLFNFISVSITYKKKEIGILRAVGARSTDVFKIFFSESTIIAGICFILAVIASFILCDVLNNLIASALSASLLVFGPYSLLLMLGIAVVTSFIATFLPVYSIAKKKPVESIRAL